MAFITEEHPLVMLFKDGFKETATDDETQHRSMVIML